MKTRTVAIYARVSSAHEAQLSALENQVQYYDEILAKHPEWHLYDKYIDEGITGTSTKKRKNFLRMMKDAEEGRFDLIITREVSRFARNTVDTLQETRNLKKIGIEVWFTEDNIWTLNDEDGELRLTIMATLAQNESKKTSMRVKAGQMISYKNAVPYGSGNILGYDKVGDKFVINPEQAETVKLIFGLYLKGYGIRSIKFELERLGRLTAMGKTTWFNVVISKVLNNPFYCGTIVYRKSYVPDYLEQKPVKNRGQVEQIVVEGTHEPIISKEDYYRCQQIVEGRKVHARGKQNATRDMIDVWGRKLVCSCGSQFNRKVWHETPAGRTYCYQCYSVIKNGSISVRQKKGLSIEGMCDVPMISRFKLDLMASVIFKNFWKDRKQVIEIANDMLKHGYDGDPEQDARLEKIKEYKDLLSSIDKKIDNLLDLRINDVIDTERYSSKRKELLDKQEELKKKLEVLNGGLPQRDEVNLEKKLVLLKYALKQDFKFDNAVIPDSIIEDFVEKVVVYKDKFVWYLTFFDNCDKVLYSNVEKNNRKKTDESVKVWEGAYNGETQHRPLSMIGRAIVRITVAVI